MSFLKVKLAEDTYVQIAHTGHTFIANTCLQKRAAIWVLILYTYSNECTQTGYMRKDSNHGTVQPAAIMIGL
jgi:hypothetical protein